MTIQLKQFRKTLSYTIQASVANILADLSEIEEINTFSELKRKQYAKKALYYLLGLVASFVLFLIVANISLAQNVQSLIVILLFLAFIILAIAWIYALFRGSRFKQLNVGAFRCELTKRLVKMLARDMDTAAVIDLQLSFQPIERKESKVNTINHPQRSGWKIDNFQDTWLKIKGQFLDKTRFELTTTSMCKKQYGWKRTTRGKTKYKSKVKPVGLDINLSLTYPQRRYGAVRILKNEVSDAIKLPDLSYVKRLRVTEKTINLGIRTAPEIIDDEEAVYQVITAMFLSIYQVLNLAKIIAK